MGTENKAKGQVTKAAILDRLRAMGPSIKLDAQSTYTIDAIKPYVAPGNRSKVKGRMAVWLGRSNARRSTIVFVDIILAAVRFIKEPAKRGRITSLEPGSFAYWASQQPAYRSYPSTHTHAVIYLALAKIVLDLPPNWVEPVSVRDQAIQEAVDHPDIRSNDGLLLDTLYAFVEGADAPDPADLPARAFTALCRRYGDSPKTDLHPSLVLEIRELSDRGKANPDSEDIVDAPVVWFAFLYLNALEWMGRIRASAVTTVVNRLADAHDAGMLKKVARRMDRKVAMAAATEEADIFKITRLIRRF